MAIKYLTLYNKECKYYHSVLQGGSRICLLTTFKGHSVVDLVLI